MSFIFTTNHNNNHLQIKQVGLTDTFELFRAPSYWRKLVRFGFSPHPLSHFKRDEPSSYILCPDSSETNSESKTSR